MSELSSLARGLVTPGRSPSLVERWVALWDEREQPHLLVLIRILLSSCVLADLAFVGSSGLARWLWTPSSAGGIAVLDPGHLPLLYRVLPAAPLSALLLWSGMTLSIAAVGVGFFTRSAALAFVVLSAQAGHINPEADRAVDQVVRLALVLVAFSAAGKAWSVDARLQTGSFVGELSPANTAWPRYLLLGLLVLIYAAAGLSKGGTRWFPWGGYGALYVILQDPSLAAHDFGWLGRPIPYFFTQVATAATYLWEVSAPVVVLAAHYRRTAERPGRLRRLVNRLPVRNVYVAVGVVFHLMLALSMQLGIFPFAMLALFPAFFRPEELRRALATARGWRERAQTLSGPSRGGR